MDKFVIEGGERLSGTVKIGGAKNAVLPIMVASLLAEKGETVINQVPDLAKLKGILKIKRYP